MGEEVEGPFLFGWLEIYSIVQCNVWGVWMWVWVCVSVRSGDGGDMHLGVHVWGFSAPALSETYMIVGVLGSFCG